MEQLTILLQLNIKLLIFQSCWALTFLFKDVIFNHLHYCQLNITKITDFEGVGFFRGEEEEN